MWDFGMSEQGLELDLIPGGPFQDIPWSSSYSYPIPAGFGIRDDDPRDGSCSRVGMELQDWDEGDLVPGNP